MRKVAALAVMLGLTAATLLHGEVVATVASRFDLSVNQCGLDRAEPLCPLC